MKPYFCSSFEARYRQHPLVFVDVGARGGVPLPWKDVESDLKVVAFEPDARSYEVLEGAALPAKIALMVGLYKERARRKLFLTRDAGDSSILEPNRAYLQNYPNPERFDVVGSSEIELDALDNQLESNHIDDVDFLKIDTQGSELFVLEGADKTLRQHGLGVEVEVEFVEVYRGQPLFPQVNSFMTERGYELFDLRPVYWKSALGREVGSTKGRLTWADALYLRSTPSLREQVTGLSKDRAQAKIMKAMAIRALYGYSDHALLLLDEMREHFSAPERQLLTTAIHEGCAPDLLPDFPGRRLVARALYKAWRRILPRRTSWHQIGSGETLGNLE